MLIPRLPWRLSLLAALLLVVPRTAATGAPPVPAADAIVVGSGIAGLSAALELGRAGARVTVVDMASVFGGHAVMAQGLLCIVGTPVQERAGVVDSFDLAAEDFQRWGEDPDMRWVRRYVETSRVEIFDWLRGMGVGFQDNLDMPPGNRVPRGHFVVGRGIAMVSPVYRECLETPGITFLWNVRVDELVRSDGRITGVRGRNLRTGAQVEMSGRVVVLATGGFQSNLEKVRASWPEALPVPPRLLLGGGVNAQGSGLEMASRVEAQTSRLDHQWNYITGLPDPRFPGTNRGLHAMVPSVWVNLEGRRFMAESANHKLGMPVLLRQKDATYWAVFGQAGRQSFFVSGSDWSDFSKVESRILNNPDLVKQAASIEELARKIGVPPAALRQTIERYNEQVARGRDDDFGAFSAPKRYGAQVRSIEGPVYYAAQFFPLTRKSMGGLTIDLSARVLDLAGQPIPGLYAAGELTGLAGINGKAGLEGTFLGPSLVTGRTAGRSALREIGKTVAPPPSEPRLPKITPEADGRLNPQCLACHQLPQQVATPREGYWHFEKVHQRVLEKGRSCLECHSGITLPYEPAHHRIDRVAQIQACAKCHQGEHK